MDSLQGVTASTVVIRVPVGNEAFVHYIVAQAASRQMRLKGGHFHDPAMRCSAGTQTSANQTFAHGRKITFRNLICDPNYCRNVIGKRNR